MMTAESVWELDPQILSDPVAVRDLIAELWEGTEDAKAVAFDLADGLYWHCADWHEGQWSARYRVMCSLDYSPGAGECSPEEGDEERQGAFYVYSLLSQGTGA